MPLPGGPQPTEAWGFEKRTCRVCGERAGGSPYRLCKCQREEQGVGDTQPHNPAPFWVGDWVAEVNVEQPHFGRVKDTYSGEPWSEWKKEKAVTPPPEWLIDIDLWTPDGKNPGRMSPPEGGPTKYEPACPASHYRRIEKPELPFYNGKFTLMGGYAHLLKFL